MPDNVVDLDLLRRKERFIKLEGREIEISFIPTAITFDVDDLVTSMSQLDMEKVQAEDKEETKKAFDLSIKLCATFCKWKYPEMDEQWLLEHTNVWQIHIFAEEIKKLLAEAYQGAEKYGKKAEATQQKK